METTFRGALLSQQDYQETTGIEVPDQSGVLKNPMRGAGNPFPALVIRQEGVPGGAKGGNYLTAGLFDKPRSCGAPGFFNKPNQVVPGNIPIPAEPVQNKLALWA